MTAQALENLRQVKLGDTNIGDVIIWEAKTFGPVYAEVLQKHEAYGKVTVRADNNIMYDWDVDMEVWVD